ncbi:hypothetical protein D5086_016386 [Populus alba]|uniref:Uncharacterized protein n=1 Tax=Populus alba TaxID=43335 RepID=A0ACC4BVA9_POPAL
MKYIPFFGTKFGTTRSRTVGGDSKYYNIADHEKVDELGLKDKEGSFKADPSLELPSFDESEEEKQKKQEDDPEVDGRENLCKYEEYSWQILVPKSCTKKEEQKTHLKLGFTRAGLSETCDTISKHDAVPVHEANKVLIDEYQLFAVSLPIFLKSAQ